MTDLYQLLGVRKNASPKTLQKAFRKRAMEHHPDRGGDPQKFQEVQRAYQVLSDPARRARYDATGQVDERAPDNRQAAEMGLLAAILRSALAAVLKASQRVEAHDLVALVRQGLANRRQELRQRQTELEKLRASYRTAAGRCSAREGESLLAQLAEAQAVQIDTALTRIGAEQALADRAEKLLEGESFRHEASGWATATSTATSGRTFYSP